MTVSIDGTNANYLSLFLVKLKAKADDIFGSGMFFDTIQLKLVPKGSMVPKMYASSDIDLYCFNKVMGISDSDPYAYYSSSEKCYPKTYSA